MRLRTYESFWLLKNGLLCTYPMLQQHISTDILVVGGGITGALISDALMQQGYQVVLIDKRDIASGSTAATTSMLQYEIDTPLTDLAKIMGEGEAAYCYQAGIAAIDELEKLVKRYDLNCGFARKQSLYLAHNKKATRQLYQEYQLRDKYQLGVEWLEPETLISEYGLQAYGAIRSGTAASVDAYRLAHLLIQRNHEKGMQVYDQTEIKDTDHRDGNTYITTTNDNVIRCKKIVYCSGFESTKLLREKVARLFYTYACVSEEGTVVPGRLDDVLVWNTANPYLYMRTTDDGRVLIGGEDSDRLVQAGQQRKKEKKSARLMEKISELVPGLHFIEDFSWGGVFGSTRDGLPYIGATPEHPNSYFVLGFGGNGITFSVQGRQIIADLLAGRDNKLAEYYRFGR